ncbi:MAG: accessory factor UbiK family protein [Methylococcus sp.]|jgi:ubiquinone biosynthesis accessory factor UbiK|nr:MAG: accessory factor UbiK family protein [Methylococcus sp.]
MFEPSNLNDLARKLSQALPNDLQLLRGDIEKTFQAILQASFSRMNLVSREEFDVQKSVLLKTRQQLERLEARVEELEKAIHTAAGNQPSPQETR